MRERTTPTPTSRRVYRNWPLYWVGPLTLVVVGVVTWCYSPARGFREILAFLVLATGVLWVSWWPRLVIEAEGVRLFPLTRSRSRFLAWSQIEQVRLGGVTLSSPQGVLLTVAGQDVPAAVPSVGLVGGQRYTQEAVEDVRAAWRRATGRTGT